MWKRTGVVAAAATLAMVAAACAGGSVGSSNEEKLRTNVDLALEVGWDGEECRVDGATHVDAELAIATVTARNQSDHAVRFLVNKLDPGTTLEQVADYGRVRGVTKARPPFATSSYVWIRTNPGDEVVEELTLEEGHWFAGCGIVDLDQVLVGELFDVGA